MAEVGKAVSAGKRPLAALALVVGLATLREGSEVVLFLYGIVAAGASVSSLLLGGVLGLAAGALFTALTYYGLLAIPARHIFTVTTMVIALLAAGMAAQAVQFLDAAGLINVMGQRLWDRDRGACGPCPALRRVGTEEGQVDVAAWQGRRGRRCGGGDTGGDAHQVLDRHSE